MPRAFGVRLPRSVITPRRRQARSAQRSLRYFFELFLRSLIFCSSWSSWHARRSIVKGSRIMLSAGFLLTILTVYRAHPRPARRRGATARPPRRPAADRQAQRRKFPDRDFSRLNLDKLRGGPPKQYAWRPDRHPRRRSIKAGFLSHNQQFPPGVMSPTHPDNATALCSGHVVRRPRWRPLV